MINLKTKVKNIATKFHTALFPSDICCIFCNQDLKIESDLPICDDCFKTLPFNNQTICLKCGKPKSTSNCQVCLYTKHYFDKARAPFIYDDKISSIIYKLKFGDGKYLAKPLAKLMYYEFIKSNFEVDALIAVPIHEKTMKKRHFNQAHELLLNLNTHLNLPDLSTCLKKVAYTKEQARLEYNEREHNLDNAFKVIDKDKLKAKSILLIDDVFTTGSTCNTISKLLLKNGVKKVYVLTLAHTPYKKQ